MATHDERFYDYSYDFIQNLIRKSMPISDVGERERMIFFNLTRQRIELYKNNEIKTLGKMTPYF